MTVGIDFHQVETGIYTPVWYADIYTIEKDGEINDAAIGGPFDSLADAITQTAPILAEILANQ